MGTPYSVLPQNKALSSVTGWHWNDLMTHLSVSELLIQPSHIKRVLLPSAGPDATDTDE